jgi:hypothetical protein
MGCNTKLLARLTKTQTAKVATQEGRKTREEWWRWRASSDSESSEENCICCQEIFSHSKAGEVWVKCSLCGYRAHDACAGVEEEDCDECSCDMCNNSKQTWLALMYHCSLKTISELSCRVIQIIKFTLLQYIAPRITLPDGQNRVLALFYKIHSYSKTIAWNKKKRLWKRSYNK